MALAAEGLFQTTICYSVGISRETLRLWLKDPSHAEFAEKFRAAESKVEAKASAAVFAKDPVFWIKKRFPTRWGDSALPDTDEPAEEAETAVEELVEQRVADRLHAMAAKANGGPH